MFDVAFECENFSVIQHLPEENGWLI